MQIIDSHTHVGPDRLFSLPPVSPDELLAAMDRYQIHVSLVMPQPGVDRPEEVHDLIAGTQARWPARIRGIALPDLRGSQDAYAREAERCVRDLGFVALKFHTAGHAVSPTSPLGRVPFELASALGVPLMIHTGYQIPYALPSLVAVRAREFPDLSLVLCHAGMAPYAQEALDLALTRPNVYLEPSWLPVYALRQAVQKLGPERILFGSDIILNVPVELAKFQALDLAPADHARCLGANAAALFHLAGLAA